MCQFFPLNKYSSTTCNRNALRGVGTAEIMGTTLQMADARFLIPQALAQSIISCYTLFRVEPHFGERIIHFMLASIALSQVGILITLLFQRKTCETTDYDLCLALLLTHLLKRGTYLAGYLPSEYSKDPYTGNNDNAPRVNPAPIDIHVIDIPEPGPNNPPPAEGNVHPHPAPRAAASPRHSLHYHRVKRKVRYERRPIESAGSSEEEVDEVSSSASPSAS